MDAGVREAASALGAEKGSVILKTVPDVRPQLAEMLIEAVREGIAERAELRDAAA
jgi:ABC-type phosphate transport system permease subunit